MDAGSFLTGLTESVSSLLVLGGCLGGVAVGVDDLVARAIR